MFQWREYFPELGLYDYRHRFYDPWMGRFLQTDPLRFDAGDMNLFRYCGDDPVDQSDPTGLEIEYHGNPDNWRVTQQYVSRSHLARQIIADAGRLRIPIYENNAGKTRNLVYGPNRVDWDPHSGLQTKPDNRFQSPAIGVIHDLDHAVRKASDHKGFINDMRTPDAQYGKREERRAVERERIVIQELNSGEAERYNHGGTSTRTSGPTSKVPTRASFGADPQGNGSDAAEAARSSSSSESSGPTAAHVDSLYLAPGVPSLGAESSNFVRASRL